jgi:hypothetical protein
VILGSLLTRRFECQSLFRSRIYSSVVAAAAAAAAVVVLVVAAVVVAVENSESKVFYFD